MPHQIFFSFNEISYALQRQNTEISNRGLSVPISTFMCLWVIYIFQRSVCLICWRKYVDRSWEYINRDWGRAVLRKGIHKWDFRCSAFRGHKPFCRFLWLFCTDPICICKGQVYWMEPTLLFLKLLHLSLLRSTTESKDAWIESQDYTCIEEFKYRQPALLNTGLGDQ